MDKRPGPKLHSFFAPGSRRWQRAAQGMAVGLAAGGLGAFAYALWSPHAPLYLLALVALPPAFTGLLCGLRAKPRQTVFAPRFEAGRTPFKTSFVSMGSRLVLHAFLVRFGVSRGFLGKMVDQQEKSPATRSPAPLLMPEAEILKNFEKQHSTVTTISYDSQTNRATSDTIGRDQLASARLALLSMDHTKQIPH